MTARKLFIVLVTVAGLLVLYIIYGFFNSAPMPMLDSNSTGMSDTNATDSGSKMGKVGTTSIGPVVKSVFIDYDEHKNVKREFGFDKLLHESGNEWTIEKPYMNIIEKDFVCGITADSGKVQVEMAAGKPVPKDAQLSGNVVVHIVPEKGARMSESFIYLDDISFISEKSLFTTEGPVRFVSADAEMVGKGLEVIYNAGKDRLELMHLMKLEYLRLKTFKESMFAKQGGASQDDQAKAAVGAPGSAPGAAGADGRQSGEQHYRCTLNKNVAINYGSQAVLADEVTISNLFWPKNKAGSDKKDVASNENTTNVDTAEEIIPVVITCDNGIIVRPMEAMASTAEEENNLQRMLEFTGTPVTIKTGSVAGIGNVATTSGSRILAECGWLKYNLDLGILDMFSGNPPQNVLLNLEQEGSKLETTDSLRWSIKDRTAVIRGPGTLYLAAKDTVGGGQKSDADKARMNFGGTMNVYFTDETPKKSLQQAVGLKSIYLAGGFTAAMPKDKAHLAADSATFNFAKNNAISEANLDGNVKVNSDTGSLQTQKAKVLFAGDNAISEANLDGGVNFNSDTGSLQSQTAKVLFDKDNAVSQADLNGNVHFASSTGSLTSENAKVFFTKDSKGQMYASTVQSTGNVEIVPAKAKGSMPQGVFRAQRIDYDVPKGYAVAKGPVELTFHTGGKTAGDINDVPVTITAKQKAEYSLKSNEVVFDGDVVGKMVKSDGRINEYIDFYGDRLIAKVGRVDQNKTEPAVAGGSSIEHLTITGDIVKFESYQKQQDAMLGGIKLKCRQVDYDGIKSDVLASGGKDCFVFIDNSKATESTKSGGRFDPRGPGVIYLRDFENLQWHMTDNHINADGVSGGMHLDYLPFVQGNYGQKAQIDTSHVQIDLTQTPAGRKEVSALKATGGIYYREENNYELYGNELTYDRTKSLINIKRDASRPCIANGVIVDGITIDLSNGRVQAQATGLHGSAVPVPPKNSK